MIKSVFTRLQSKVSAWLSPEPRPVLIHDDTATIARVLGQCQAPEKVSIGRVEIAGNTGRVFLEDGRELVGILSLSSDATLGGSTAKIGVRLARRGCA